jgi:hypothetical protein
LFTRDETVSAEPGDDASALERTVHEGVPISPPARNRKSKWATIDLHDEPSAEVRAAQRLAARHVLRLYCFACGRSSTVAVAPVRPGRCEHCGGSMLVEVAPD